MKFKNACALRLIKELFARQANVITSIQLGQEKEISHECVL